MFQKVLTNIDIKKSLYIGVCIFFAIFFNTVNTKNVYAIDGEVTYTATNTNLTGDDVGAGPFNLGFTFNFYGSNFSSAYININGTLNFTELYSSYSNVVLSTPKSGTNISDYSIYAFWDDLNTNASGNSGNRPIYYATVGSEPNRKFVTQWTNIYFHGTTVQMGTFQIILYEGSNDVQIQYRDLLGNASQPNRELGNSATIGLRKNDSYRNQYSHDSAAITSGQAIRYTPTGANTYSVNTNAAYDLIYLAPEGSPISPTLVTPTDGLTGVTLTPSFEWLPVESATSYRILVSTASNFSSLVVDHTTSGTSYTHGSNLNTNTQYYWRVQSINSNGSSLSPTRTFSTASVSNTAPNIPNDVSSTGLLGGSTIMSMSGKTITMNLSDADENEQLRYRLQIATDSAFNSLLIDYRSAFGDSGVTTYTFGQSGGTYLVGNSGTTIPVGNYYVRFRAEDDSAASSNWYSSGSVAFTLEENIAPDAPSELGESQVVSGNAINLSQPSFVFTLHDDNSSNAIQYELEIDDSEDFSSPVVQYISGLATQGVKTFTVGQEAGTGTYTIGNSEQELSNGSYYWRVRAIDSVGETSAYSTARSGQVAFIINTSVPDISDIEVTSLSDTSVRISWETSDESSSQVEYGLVSSYGFTTNISNTSPRVNHHEVELNSLESCIRYFYRVKSANNANTQTYSERHTFTTTGCSTTPVIDGTEAIVEVEGGALEFNHGSSIVKLTVPPSFSSEKTYFQINLLDFEASPPPPNTFKFLDGNIFNLVAITESGVKLDTFDEPVTFSFTYSESLKQQYQSQTLDVYKFNPDTELWEKKNCSNDLSINTLTCTLPSFSIYGVFGQPHESKSSTKNEKTSKRQSKEHHCSINTPISTPELFQVTSHKTNATLYFVPSSSKVTEYIVEYGTTPEANQHAVRFSHTDTSGAIPYTIHSLTPQSTWYFKVQASKKCQSSSWSSTKSVFVGNIPQIVTQPPEIKSNEKPEETATVSVIQEEMLDTTDKEKTYTLRVKVSQDQQSLQNVKVVLAGTQQEVLTDNDGFAIFEQIKGGLHHLKIIDKAFASEEEITVQGENDEFDVLINVSANSNGITPQAWIAIIIAVVIGFGLSLLFIRLKS